MRIIDSSRLWDNRNRSRSTKFYTWFGIACILLFTLLLNFANQYLELNHKTISSDIVIASEDLRSGPRPDLTSNPEELMPEKYNPSIYMVNAINSVRPKAVSTDCKRQACIALTFDDGPNNESTAKIIDVLEKAGAKASFFEIGRYIKGNEALLVRMSRNGFDIGNHSWSHTSFTKLGPNQIRHEISKTNQAIANAGVETPRLIRPPYGEFTLPMLKFIKVPVILWNIDPKDWDKKSSKEVVKVVEQQIRKGGILVMHDKKLTAEALPKILKDLKGKYKFVTVSELLGLNDKSKGIYIGR